MPKTEPKKTPLEKTQEWLAAHADEGLSLQALKAAAAAVEKKTGEVQAAAGRLGELLEARKAAVKALKAALKQAKADRKAPKPAPAPKPAATPKTPAAPKGSAPRKAPAAKKAPAEKSSPN